MSVMQRLRHVTDNVAHHGLRDERLAARIGLALQQGGRGRLHT